MFAQPADGGTAVAVKDAELGSQAAWGDLSTTATPVDVAKQCNQDSEVSRLQLLALDGKDRFLAELLREDHHEVLGRVLSRVHPVSTGDADGPDS